MQNLTMSLEEEEYDGTGDEEGSESDYSECHVSQLHFLLGKKWKNDFEEVVNVSTEPHLPLPQNYEERDFRQLTQPDGKGHLSTSVATISVSGQESRWNLISVLFGNSKNWARLELLCPIAVLESKDYTINFGSAILGHLDYCLDQASKQEVKYIDDLFQLIEYHCYEYCQIDHHILIDNRLDDFWPRINMKDALKREVIITGNISRKRVLLQCPFGGYEWYLGDRCWAQLEHRAVSYDPPEKLYCFPTSDVVRSLRAAGWIEAQHYIVGHHIDYDAHWRHVSHGALMSDIARCENINIPCLGTLTSGVTFPHVEFPTADFSTQETQIPPLRLGYYPGWIMKLGSPHGTTWHTIPSIASTSTIDVPT
ncbi:hypothetical protein GIB67_010647 [Kingdonia uniflora]|uniref:Uncharacterized protein n=1 Tax=Kingdonia uniflora TaxID=39325 RepID=A0A7J7L785_9MAGN|nr:hypothetical protein GIB67_010647 [Kingdonia uniflora]